MTSTTGDMPWRASLHRVLDFTASYSVPEEWREAGRRLESDRYSVLGILQDPSGPRVYGFNTLLGHLDGETSVVEDQDDLLHAHLVGPTWEVDPHFLRLMTACKLEQLSRGGTGIDPATYQALLDKPEPDGRDGAWFASYGSGDVVPAAWWVSRRVIPVAGPLRAGDLISLINGNFVSTAAGVVVVTRLVDVVTRFVAQYVSFAEAGPPAILSGTQLEAGKALEDLLQLFPPSSEQRARQLPVSVRDAGAVLRPIVLNLSRLIEALCARLERPSGNPLFAPDAAGRWRAWSQASFLDVQLTLELTNAMQMMHLLCGVTQRLAEHAVEGMEGPRAQVQPPKVVKALVEQAHLVAGVLPAQFTGSDSHGVEDLRDLSLLTAVRAVRLCAVLDECVEVLSAVIGPPRPPVLARVREIMTRGGTAPHASSWDQWSEAVATSWLTMGAGAGH